MAKIFLKPPSPIRGSCVLGVERSLDMKEAACAKFLWQEGARFADGARRRQELWNADSESGNRKPVEVGSDQVSEGYNCLFVLLKVSGLVADQYPHAESVHTTGNTNGPNRVLNIKLLLLLQWLRGGKMVKIKMQAGM